MRTINAKLALGLLIGCIFCTGAVFGVHHFQYRRIADALLWQARHAEEQGQPKRQAKYLQRYLEFNPNDLAEKANLARLWAGDAFAGSSRERLKAVNLLDQVLTRGEDQPELRRLLVKSALEVNALKMARNHLEKLLPRGFLKSPVDVPVAAGQPVDPGFGEAEGYAGQLWEAENHPEDALTCYRLAVRHAPQVEANYLRLAWLLRNHKEIDPRHIRKNQQEADRTLDALVRDNPQSHTAYLARWQYRREFGLIQLDQTKNTSEVQKVALKDAAEDVMRALERAPEAVDVLLAAADLERLRGQAAARGESAAADKERRLNEHRDKALAYLTRGLKLHAQHGGSAASNLTHFQLLWHKANLLLDEIERLDSLRNGSEQVEAARRRELAGEVDQVIGQIRKTRGSPAAAEYLKARLLLQDRRWAEAVALFEQVRPTLGTRPELASQINLYLAQGYEQLEEPGQMFKAFERLLQGEPDSVAAVLGMAQAEWAMGHLDNAAEKFQRLALAGQIPAKVWLDYARLEIQRQAQKERPDWGHVEKLLRAASEANKDSATVPLMTAQMWLVREPDAERARQVLKQAQAARPAEIELWTARIHLELRDKRFDEARKILNEAKKARGDQVPLRLAEARLLAEADPNGAGAAIDRLASDSDKFPEEERVGLLNGLAETQLSLENVSAARQLWRRVAKLPGRQTDLRLHLLLFDLAVKADDEEDMQRTLADIRTVEGEQGPFHRYGEALRWIEQAKKKPEGQRQRALEEAKRQLERVQKVRPSWPLVFLARAQIERASGRPDQAISNLQEAIRYGETSPAVIRELVELLASAERYAEADEALRHLREPLLVNSELGRLAAVVAVNRQDPQRALQILERNRSRPDTTDYRDLLWEGRMLAELNKTKEAEEKFRQAVRLASTEPEPYVALVQFLARQKREKDADAVLTEARKRLPAERAELALAQCDEALGRKKLAQARYEGALKEHPQDATIVRRVAEFYWDNGDKRAAEPLLRALVEGRVQNPSADDVGWARRHLALFLAGGNEPGRFREALELVGLKLDSAGRLVRDPEHEKIDSTDTRRFQARVLATQAVQRSFRRRAMELLEELERSKSLRPDDRFLLAMLYEAEGEWPKARTILRELAREREPAPVHLAHYVRALLEHKEIEEAAREIDRLEELERQRGAGPNAFAAVELRARLLEEEQGGRGGDKALRLLEQLINRPQAQPEEVLLVLNALMRQKRFTEALDRCLKTWADKKCSAEMIGGVSVAVLNGMQTAGMTATDAQVRLIEGHLKDALEQHPRSVVLMLHLASLYDLRGRWDEAESIYRRVLRPENDPKNIVALNNLAWLLAQRSSDPQKAQEALTRIEAALNDIGRRADLIDTRGLVYLKLGQESEALADFREAAADMPTPVHLFHLARAHYQRRDKTSAFKVLKQAKERGLEASVLHPVEQETYQRLLEELKIH